MYWRPHLVSGYSESSKTWLKNISGGRNLQTVAREIYTIFSGSMYAIYIPIWQEIPQLERCNFCIYSHVKVTQA